MTLDDYLAARMITTPFRLYDCAAPVDGSTAVIVSAPDHASAVDHPVARVESVGTALRGHGDGIEFRCAWFGGSVLGHGRQSEKNGGGQSADAQRTAAVTMGMSHDMES